MNPLWSPCLPPPLGVRSTPELQGRRTVILTEVELLTVAAEWEEELQFSACALTAGQREGAYAYKHCGVKRSHSQLTPPNSASITGAGGVGNRYYGIENCHHGRHLSIVAAEWQEFRVEVRIVNFPAVQRVFQRLA